MAKQLNVNLAFTADTSQAKAQLQSLQTQLSGLLNSTNGQSFGNQITGDINKASKAIAELKLHLKNATNVNTGNLDFTKLNESLNKSGTTLQQYGDKLRDLGPAGQQAFNTLASSIAQSEIPIRRSNAVLTEFATTLKNTVRWQISSSILHGFMGTISGAVGYVKDLNKSLNDIRIVTGASVDEMARFAEQANRSAKALGASTTAYTKASLIYYQQGLDDQAVKERTDVTIKMANVSGQNAETVSDQMTAVWNNFAKGGEDLERFADVMVRLGADTASSSDEIAQGLEKFAAIGDMVGLSFDNAAAALATVTATTRQSADVVGTAFKTIFARIQGLKLGETLEDGTDLNKYSEALATVGISIKEQNGELKDMDTILAEMGAKWQTLSKDQQVALAQTVAGARQYNQLVALMDHFDFYEQNLQSAKNAEGSLQEQADIYAESWQAASDRVKAATQGIYENLLNDEAFIDVLNIIEKILTYIDNLIDGLGGLGGVLTTVGALLTRAFSSQIAQSMTGIVNGIKMMTAAGREQAQQQKAQFMKDSADAMRDMSDGSNEGNMRATMMEDQLRLQTSMIENSERMSAEEQQINQMLLDRQRILSDNAIAAAKELDAATEARSDATFNARVELAQEARGWAGGDLKVQRKNLSDFTKQFNQVQQKLKQGITARVNLEELRKLPVEGEKGKQVIDKIKQAVDKIDDAEIKEIVNSLDSMELNAENVEDAIAALTIRLREMQDTSEANMMDENNEWMLSEDAVHGLSEAYENEATAALRVKDAEEQANEARDNAANSINNATGAQKTWADQMVTGANVVMSLLSVLQAFSGIIDVATNPDMSGWEKFLSIGSSLAMMFVMLAPLLTGTNLQFLATAAASVGAAVGMKAESVAALEATAATGSLSASLWTLLWPIGLVMAAIAALVAIIWVLSNSLNAEEKSAKAAEQTLESLSSAYEQAKKRAEDFKETVSNYDSAIEALDGLKKGTQEYIEQLKKANEEARGLIETYGLYDNYYYDSEGIIRFTKGALEEKQNYLDIQAKEAKATEYGAKAVVAGGKGPDKFAVGETGSYSDQIAQELFKRIDNGELKVSALEKTTESSTNTNGSALSESDNYRTALNEITGDLISTYTPDDAYGATFGLDEARQNLQNILIETFTDQNMREKFANYSRESDENFTQVFDNFQQGYGQYITSKNVDKINEISNGDANTQAIIENIVANRLSETEAREKNITGQLAQIKKDAYNADEGDLKKLYKEEIQDLNGGNGIGNVMNDEDLARLYAREVLGREDWETLSYDGGSGKGTLKDDNTAIEGMDEKSDEEMRRELYQKAKAEELYETVGPEVSDEAFFKAIDKITNSTGELEQKMGADFSQAILTSLQNGVETIDFSSILGDISIDELNTLQGIDNSEDLLKQLGLTVDDVTNAGYESAEAFYNAFKNGIDNIDSADLEAAFDAKLQGMVSKDAEAYELDEENLQEVAKGFQELADSGDKAYETIKDDAEGIADAATRYKRLNNAIEDLNKNYEEYSEVLNDVKKATNAVEKNDRASTESAKKLKKSLADLLDTSEELIDTNFLEAINPKDFQAAASGDEAAINRIRNSFIDAQADALNFEGDIAGLKSALAGLEEGATINVNETPALEAMIRAMAQAGYTADEIKLALSGFGIDCDITPLTSAMAEAASAAQGAGDAIIDNLSMDIQDNSVTTTDTDTKEDVGFDEEYSFSEAKKTNMVMKNGEDEATPVDTVYYAASKTITPKKETETENKTQTAHALQVSNAHKSAGGKVASSNKKAAGGGGGGGGKGGKGGGGGGGNKPKVVQKKAPIKPKKEKDEIERYHEITKAIEDQERLLDRLSKAKDKAYGENKLKAIDKEIAALQKLNELDSQHLKQIKQRLQLDKKAASDKGITFDINGRINNYDEIIQKKMDSWLKEQEDIQKREIEYEESKNADENYDADGAIKLQIDQDKEKSDENYEEFKEAITQYEETFGLFEDTVDKMQDQFDQMAEKAIEKITYEVEFKVEFEESAIDLLDFQIELLGEDFDAFAEIASITMEKTTHLSKALQTQSDGVGALYEAYDKGAISLDQFVENMKESLPDILSSMQNMISLDKEMMEYYSKAFDAAEEKFTEYLDFIDSGISKLDHFQNMLSLIGKEQNYDMLGVVLESQYTSASHRLQASSDWYETTKKEYDALYNRWIAEKNLLGPKELEMLEEKLKVARTKMQEADEQRLSDLEAVGEKAQEILQNNLNMARKKFEENLVESSLEDYMNELDRLSKKQEEYLTNTNKMYETNKLIRQAQMEMDKTDNNRAKQQYNDYVKYIEQLQETGKLSSYELSVAQAKYELLQAQIALEEAKDAKDQVRLTRDSEGNYGYVYTANEDKVSDAEQAVADAENKLYNIGLDGAQDYQSKKAEILQEAIDTFASIEEQYQTGQIKTETEFNAKMEEAKQYYYNRLKEYDNLYYMALGVMQEESYGNTIDYELDSRNVFDTFATHVDGYLGDVEQSFTDYDNKIGVVKQEVGDDLEAMRKKTEEVTKETEKLTLEAEKLTDQIDNELLSVREATSIWGAYRDELYKNIEANKTLIEQLRTIQELQGGELADYSSFISDQVAKGKGYDDRLIQEALAKRWLKMEGKDDYDYSQIKNDYVQEYADLNGLTFEEAETALQDDAWYKTLGILRQYKIERTDWAAKKKEILEKDPKADVSWIDNIIAEKLSYDWAAKIQQYIERNPGLKYDDEYLQEMLTIRQIKIDSLKNPKDVTSNEELLAPYIEKGVLIDNRKNISSAVSAATGGYTGEWGPEGKIAILHEKELILNAQDTQNFLSAVEILREINGILDQNALVASLGAINMQALSLNSLADQVLQQEVTIHADFPNVTDHNEIELAIDNLINAASQHAYRT